MNRRRQLRAITRLQPLQIQARRRACCSAMALLAVLASLGGCGGSSSNDQAAKFKTSYESARNHLRGLSQAIGTEIQKAPSQSDRQILTAFRSLAGRWQTQLSQLEALKPPGSVSVDFNTLTGAASRVESDLNAVVSAAATHSYSAAQQAGASIVSDVTAARRADATIAHKLRIA
jgi:hypothetical protein